MIELHKGIVQCWDVHVEECIWTYPPTDLNPLEWVKAAGIGYDSEGSIAIVLMTMIIDNADHESLYLRPERSRMERQVVTPLSGQSIFKLSIISQRPATVQD